MKKLIQYIRPYIKMMSFGLTIKFIAALADLFIQFLPEAVPRYSFGEESCLYAPLPHAEEI